MCATDILPGAADVITPPVGFANQRQRLSCQHAWGSHARNRIGRVVARYCLPASSVEWAILALGNASFPCHLTALCRATNRKQSLRICLGRGMYLTTWNYSLERSVNSEECIRAAVVGSETCCYVRRTSSHAEYQASHRLNTRERLQRIPQLPEPMERLRSLTQVHSSTQCPLAQKRLEQNFRLLQEQS